VRGKGGRARVVRIGHEAARALDRYLRIRSRHAQAWRPQLWLGVNNRGPMTANGIYQMIARRGRQAGVDAWTHRCAWIFSSLTDNAAFGTPLNRVPDVLYCRRE
jgi:site-specific recombinase XerD